MKVIKKRRDMYSTLKRVLMLLYGEQQLPYFTVVEDPTTDLVTINLSAPSALETITVSRLIAEEFLEIILLAILASRK